MIYEIESRPGLIPATRCDPSAGQATFRSTDWLGYACRLIVRRVSFHAAAFYPILSDDAALHYMNDIRQAIVIVRIGIDDVVVHAAGGNDVTDLRHDGETDR